MDFKKHGKQIFGVAFTKKEQEAIDAEIERQARKQEAKYLEEFQSNIDAQLLWYLYQKMHWGKAGLIKAFHEFSEILGELTSYYELPEDDTSITAKMKLKEIGVDVDALRRGDPDEI